MKLLNNSIIEINTTLLEKIQNCCEKITYSATAELFYEGQTPIVAYLIISGNVHLMKRNKVIHTLSSGSLIGAKELYNDQKTLHTAVVMPQTKLCFLSKSDIFEMLNKNDPMSEEIAQLLSA